MESYNILNCSNNKIIYGNGLFCHNKWVAKRQGHRNLEFHIVNLLEPAPQTQTATAHLQTTWTVYFDGQGTQKLSRGKIPVMIGSHWTHSQATTNRLVALQFKQILGDPLQSVVLGCWSGSRWQVIFLTGTPTCYAGLVLHAEASFRTSRRRWLVCRYYPCAVSAGSLQDTGSLAGSLSMTEGTNIFVSTSIWRSCSAGTPLDDRASV